MTIMGSIQTLIHTPNVSLKTACVWGLFLTQIRVAFRGAIQGAKSGVYKVYKMVYKTNFVHISKGCTKVLYKPYPPLKGGCKGVCTLALSPNPLNKKNAEFVHLEKTHE